MLFDLTINPLPIHLDTVLIVITTPYLIVVRMLNIDIVVKSVHLLVVCYQEKAGVNIGPSSWI